MICNDTVTNSSRFICSKRLDDNEQQEEEVDNDGNKLLLQKPSK